jgi:anti-sigma B factor antagonist
MHEQAQFSQTLESNVAVLKVSGEVDISNKEQFRAALAQGLATAGDRLLVDLQQISYMDSAGILCLINAVRDAEASGKSLSLVIEANGQLGKVFNITGLSKLCTVTESGAVRAASKTGG